MDGGISDWEGGRFGSNNDACDTASDELMTIEVIEV